MKSSTSGSDGARAIALGLLASASLAAAGPCDIYAAGKTPCVAAHATTRALYSAYSGPLYQVMRDADGTVQDISPLSKGGIANAAAQDKFCSGTTCVISMIYDQSGHGNHLSRAPQGAFNGPQTNGSDNLAAATGAPVTLNGKKAYGVFISPGTGYRNDNTKGVATGNEPEGMYEVLDGTHYNGNCCFDYGNAETSNHDTGNGHMEAIYFGDNTVWGSGSGNGPWIMADMENGLYSGENVKQNTQDQTITNRFTTAMVKGTANLWAIRGGNAVKGALSNFYSGPRPNASGYNPMSKEGAIILGIGGDNSNGAQGTFYEGVMTTGYPSDDTENAVQADIVAAKYAITSLISGPAVNVGSSISFRATTPCCTGDYIAHSNDTVNLQSVTSSSSTDLKQSASWTVRTGFANSDCVSFESVDTPGSYIRHYAFELMVNANDGSKQFGEDATFCPESGLDGQGNGFRSWSYPTRYFRHYDYKLYAASNGGPQDFDNQYLFNDDTSFVVSAAWA